MSLRSLLALSILPLGFPMASAAQPQDRDRATLSGRVVYDDTGQPVRHAAITLIDAESQQRRPSVLTDRNGELAVNSLPAGDYIVDVGAPDVIRFDVLMASTMLKTIASDPTAGNRADYPEKIHQESRRLVALYLSTISFAGQQDSRMEVRAKRGGSISGTVRYADGSPAADLDVQLFSRQGERYAPMLIVPIHAGFMPRPEKTDRRGHYQVTGLLPGEYVLSVTEPSANTGDEFSDSDDRQSLLVTWYPSASDIDRARAIQVQLGHETTGVDVAVAERRVHTLAGTLRTRRGDNPVAGASIVLFPREAASNSTTAEGYLSAMTKGALQTQSDERGRWAFHEVPDGQYVIQFSPDFAANEAWSTGGDRRRQNFVALKRDVTLAGDTSPELAIQVAAGGRLSGTVVVEGGELPGVHLSVRNSNGEPLLGGQQFGTRPDFSFAVSGLVSDDLEIVADAPRPGYYTKSITRNGAPLPTPFKVADGDDITGIEIVIAPRR